MQRFRFFVADVAHSDHAIEFLEGFSNVSFLQKFFLTTAAPRLKIVRIITVLNKSGRCWLALEHVLADYSTDPLSVSPAIYCKRLGNLHV